MGPAMGILVMAILIAGGSEAASVSRLATIQRSGRALLAEKDDIHPWATLLGNSFFFYEVQMSGNLPSWNRATRANGGWRDNAHTTDGVDLSMDASGGFYDAGDHMKYTLPMTAAFSTLGLGALLHEEGYRVAGQWDAMARNLKWAADWLMKVHSPSNNTIVTQVGNLKIDHAYWGRPEQQGGNRPTKTGKVADVMGGAAAVLAAASLVMSRPGAMQDKNYSTVLLNRAKDLLPVADVSPGLTSDSSYTSSHYKDELALGYLMVCWAELQSQPALSPSSCVTGLARYDAAHNMMSSAVNWDWDSKFFAASALLQLLGPPLVALNDGFEISSVKNAITYMNRTMLTWQDKNRACPTSAFDGDGKVCYTRGGLAYYSSWGSLRFSANAALGATLQAIATDRNVVSARIHKCWARSQLLYIAGANPTKQSYIVGYLPNTTADAKPANCPHHRSSSCSPDFKVTCNIDQLNADGPNPSVLKGALVGGPDNTDAFTNQRDDFVQNEVALDYNSGFSGALAAMVSVTNRLSVAGCSWTSYCSGACDSAPGHGPSQPWFLSYSPPPSPPPPSSEATPPKPPSPPPAPPKPPSPPSPPPSPPRPPSPPSPPPYPPTPPPAVAARPPPPPRPPTPPSPKEIATSTLQECRAAQPLEKKYLCDLCVDPAIPVDLQSVCLTCPSLTTNTNNEWACQSVCANPELVSSPEDASTCVDCIANGSVDSGLCSNCMKDAVTLGTRVGTDVGAQRRGCLSCVQAGVDKWACSRCLSLDSIAKIDACMSCVSANALPPWQCTMQ